MLPVVMWVTNANVTHADTHKKTSAEAQLSQHDFPFTDLYMWFRYKHAVMQEVHPCYCNVKSDDFLTHI